MAFAYPVIANGRLYIRDLGTLLVWDIRSLIKAMEQENKPVDNQERDDNNYPP